MQTVIYMASSYRCALVTFQALNKNTYGLVSMRNLLFLEILLSQSVHGVAARNAGHRLPSDEHHSRAQTEECS